MPTPLLIKSMSAASITNVRSGNVTGWLYTFKTADGLTTFGTIYDNGNSFVKSSAALFPSALRIDATLVSDAVYAIQAFDPISITFQTGGISGDPNETINIWLAARSSGVDFTVYVDTLGNTYSDSGLTNPQGGADKYADSLTVGDAGTSGAALQKDYEDELRIQDSIEDSIYTPTISIVDEIGIQDFITEVLGEKPKTDFQDEIWVSDSIRACLKLGDAWNGESKGSPSWTGESL